MLDDLVEVEVEEELPLQDGTADGAAEVVIAEKWLLRRATEVIAICIQRIVLKILVRRTVEVVRATLADLVVENTADAILRREGGLADLNLLHHFLRVDVRVGAGRQRCLRSVRQHCAEWQIAIDGKHRAIGGTRAQGSLRAHGSARGSSHQNIELRPILSYLRKLRQSLGVQHERLLSVLRLQQGNVHVDDHLL